MRILFILAAIASLSGCVSTALVTDANGNESISTIWMTCSTPHILTQNCSAWNGAAKEIEINGFKINIAGSENGTVILVMDSKWLGNVLGDVFTLNSPTHSEATNTSFDAVKKVLKDKGIELKKVIPVQSSGNIDGYVLELGSDGYKELLPYSVK